MNAIDALRQIIKVAGDALIGSDESPECDALRTVRKLALDAIHDSKTVSFAAPPCTMTADECAALPGILEDLRHMAEGVLPDGDHINAPTQLWAEDWVRKIDAASAAAPEGTP